LQLEGRGVGQRCIAESHRGRAAAENGEPPTYLEPNRDSLQQPIGGRVKKSAEKEESRTYLAPIRNSMQKRGEGGGVGLRAAEWRQSAKRGRDYWTENKPKPPHTTPQIN
jgi:hypothetical protein